MGFGGRRSCLGIVQLAFGVVFVWFSVVYGFEENDSDEFSLGEETIPQEIRKLISILCGMASTLLWMIVGFPQFYENYKNQSGEALSVFFVMVWWSGDVLYLGGCFLTNQIPSVKLVGFWYLVMDSIFLGQMFYYDVLKKSRFWPSNNSPETQPLIEKKVFSPTLSTQNININTNENNSATDSRESASGSYGRWATSPPVASPHLSPTLPPPSPSASAGPSPKRLFVLLPLALFVLVAPVWIGGGVGGGFGRGVSSGVPSRTGRGLLEVEKEEKSILCLADTCDEGWQCVVGNGLAWGSSALFLVSRIPQIIKNFQRKSCEGLSMLMFCFAVLGNLTLAVSIFIICIEPAYLEMEAPYLVGALGTLAMDFTIFGQFLLYKKEEGFEPIDEVSKGGEKA